ncbi:MAG: DUF167 domain-containing protein [Planctomycetota bacterium]|jgi:uncharacterized protein (TIGR00251 family)
MNRLELRDVDGAVGMKLRVTPGARRSRIKGVHAGALKLSVAEPPEKGKANDGVIRLLAKALDIPAKNIEITSGLASQNKAAVLVGIDEPTLQQTISELIND